MCSVCGNNQKDDEITERPRPRTVNAQNNASNSQLLRMLGVRSCPPGSIPPPAIQGQIIDKDNVRVRTTIGFGVRLGAGLGLDRWGQGWGNCVRVRNSVIGIRLGARLLVGLK